MNNKGFAISTILYAMLLMATLVIFLLIGNFSFERSTTSEFVNNIKNELNGTGDNIVSDSIDSVDESGSIDGYLTDVTGSVVTLDDKFKIISTVDSNYAISIAGNKVSTNNSNVEISILDNVVGQEFSLVASDRPGYYYIAPASSKTFVFDIAYASAVSNTNIQLYPINYGTHQQYKFVKTGDDGVYYIQSGLDTCIDLINAIASNGNNIDSYACNKSPAQKWKIMKI